MLILQLATTLPLFLAAEKWHWRLDSPLFGVMYVLGIAWTNPPTISAWPIALAATLLLVPTFFVSVRLERRFYRHSYAEINAAAVNRSVWFANLYSYALLSIVACGWLTWELGGGGNTAPATQRTLQEHPIDVAQLHNEIIPSCDASSRPAFLASVTQLEANLADFDAFMRDVAQGAIPVRENLSTGRWQSFVDKPDTWTMATYADRLGPVMSFRSENKTSREIIYSFQLNGAGYITRVEPQDGFFSFNEKGRLVKWHREKCDCWGHADK